MDKPLALKTQEFQQNITKLINESGIPIQLIKYIIKDLYAEIDQLVENISKKEIDEYNQSQNKSEE